MAHRRALVHPDRVCVLLNRVRTEMFNRMRADLAALSFRHACELADLRRELDQTRAKFDALKAAVRARQRTENELAELYRERAIQRAQVTERDVSAPLN